VRSEVAGVILAGVAHNNPNYDPGNRYTIPWQSGFTGIAYNANRVDGEITSVKDLWNPKYRGRIGMMNDNTDLGSAGLLGRRFLWLAG